MLCPAECPADDQYSSFHIVKQLFYCFYKLKCYYSHILFDEASILNILFSIGKIAIYTL